MVKSLFKAAVASLLFAFVLLGGYSCSDDYPDDYVSESQVRRMIEEALRKNNQDFPFTLWEVVNITVNRNDWRWDENAAEWYAMADLPELKEDAYEVGAMLGYVFIKYENGPEVQKLLPYVNTYYAEDNVTGEVVYFTETVSAEYQLEGKSRVKFFIKDSQLARDPNAPQTYTFRIVLIW
ncbi:hypothetical protein [Proteiniphilum sp.]|uniref:hypothetical protein n=1 Tax=Proteiniphilum sp. TaxID=1926877 RepID=UPI002B2035F9|nr:hypothetical protein [Proteiniphilum sp.]MEA4917428.1 hypothetical protein [Proteiniphilum sp.]